MAKPCHAVKVGGSLLSRDLVGERLNRWLADRSAADATPLVLIVGGGVAVDELRRLDEQESLDSEDVHWRAIDLMAVNAAMVRTWLDAPIESGLLTDLRHSLELNTKVVFEPRRFLREEEPALGGTRLSIGWETTSDSIAARIAYALGAELTLLKSVPPPSDWTTGDNQELANQGYVDSAFPLVAGGLSSVSFESLPDS